MFDPTGPVLRLTILFIISLSFVGISRGQDLIVTKQGDSVNCKITKRKGDFVYFKFKYQGEVRNTLLNRNDIAFLQDDFYKTSEVSTGTKYRDDRFNHFRFDISAGYSYRTAPLSDNIPPSLRQHYKKLKSGYHLGLSGAYYFTEPLGVGFRYNRFASSNETSLQSAASASDKISINFIGPFVSTRLLQTNSGTGILLNFGLGYLDYRDKGNGKSIYGKTIGASLTIAYDIALSEKIALGFDVGMETGSINQYELTQGGSTTTVKLAKGDHESLTHLDVGIGLRLTL